MSKLDETLSSFDWTVIQSFAGESDNLPAAIRAVILADSEHEIASAASRLEFAVVSDGALSEACVPVATCLVAGLNSSSAVGRPYALDLLAQIASGFVYGPEHEQIGRVNLESCRQAVAGGFDLYCEMLESSTIYNERLVCVDLIALCGYYESRLRPRAVSVLRSAREWPTLQSASALIDSSLQDLTSGE